MEKETRQELGPQAQAVRRQREFTDDDPAKGVGLNRLRFAASAEPVLGQGLMPPLQPGKPRAEREPAAVTSAKPPVTAGAADVYDTREWRETFERWEFDDRGNWTGVVRSQVEFRNGEPQADLYGATRG